VIIEICVEAPCTEIILEDVEYYPPYSRSAGHTQNRAAAGGRAAVETGKQDREYQCATRLG
jgi:hypothetical protein